MDDPVLCADGQSYERAAIAAWLAAHGTSPVTGAPVDRDLTPNFTLRSILRARSSAQ